MLKSMESQRDKESDMTEQLNNNKFSLKAYRGILYDILNVQY